MTQSNSAQIIDQPDDNKNFDLDDNGVTKKEPDAFLTISEVANEIHVPQHVLRFWETRFPQLQPIKRSGGRRYYRVEDVNLLKYISELLYTQGYTIKGVQRLLKKDFSKLKQDDKVNGEVQIDSSLNELPETTVTLSSIENASIEQNQELENLRKENAMLIDSLKGVLVELQELRKIIADI